MITLNVSFFFYAFPRDTMALAGAVETAKRDG